MSDPTDCATDPVPFRADGTVREFIKNHSSLCAAEVITFWQVIKTVAIICALLLGLCWDYKIFWTGLLFVLCAFYLVTILYKALTVVLSLWRKPEIHIRDDVAAALTDAELPVYTILLPMYKEGNVAGKLLRAMDHLDYPHDKLDIKLLLEEDDIETVNTCTQLDLPKCCDLVVVPNSFPKTKPKACNHGLEAARGKYLVIYDAEDVPERDQLRKAVAAFKRVPPHVACLQVKLNYYNPKENILTRWFTMEYTTWFEFFLPGLHCLGAPIPLGGTSNHFRTAILKELGGWDPFNVTEDCDLGIRLHRRGFRTQVLDSTTWEEANERLGNWIRQRSRWVKGYFQTHLVHTRRTLRTLRELGPFGFLSFLLTVGGLSATLILNPLFWLVLIIYGGLWAGEIMNLGVEPWQMLYFDRVSDIDPSYTLWSHMSWGFFGVSVVLFLANLLFVIINIIACIRRKVPSLIPAAIISPLYWLLISVAAWKGFFQLITRPFYWEKTAHGITTAEDPELAARRSAKTYGHEEDEA